tara:strand:+ start:939 stop:1703 length:765 start_codon:yes stop_codon:yes gene_type:complete
MKKINQFSQVGLYIVIAVAIFSLSIVLSASGRYFFKTSNSEISVTGSASLNFTSDLVVWSGDFTTSNMDLKKAYAQIKNDRDIIENFLIQKGLKKENFNFLSIDIDKKYKQKNYFNNEGVIVDREQVFTGFELTQQLKVSSSDIELIEQISNEITDLIEKNIFLTSYPPKYYYTKLGELKIEMIKLASEDGLLRAKTAIEGANGTLGAVLSSNIGVFQILGANSNDSFSWGGTLNTAHKNKTAYINVKQTYEIN